MNSPYTGPLDALDPTEVEIFEISLCALAARFHELEGSLAKGAFFIALLAHLIYLKSAKLLPPAQEEQESIEELLPGVFQELEEYDLFQKAAKEFAAYEREQALHFLKGPVPLPDLTIPKPELVVLEIDAFSRLFGTLWREAQDRVAQIFEEEWKVADLLQFIRHQLGKSQLFFQDLFRVEFSKDRLIATFLAVLELLKNQEAEFVQEKNSTTWYLKAKHG